MKIEIIKFSQLDNYFKRKKLQSEIKKTEETIQDYQNQTYAKMEYLSVLKRDLEKINKKERNSNRRRKKK